MSPSWFCCNFINHAKLNISTGLQFWVNPNSHVLQMREQTPVTLVFSKRSWITANNHRSSHHGSSVAPVAAPCPDWLDNRNLGLRSVAVCAKRPSSLREPTARWGAAPRWREAPRGANLSVGEQKRRILGGYVNRITYWGKIPFRKPTDIELVVPYKMLRHLCCESR